jgi:hypothetical protein
MKQEQAHIDQIRTAFEKMQSREDLLHVLNEAKPLVYGDKAVPFELKQLTWYANPKLGRKRYTEFKIKKKSGAERCIHAPVKGLKSIQKTLSFVLQCVYEPHNAAMGFVRDRSIVDNAKLHVGSRYVYNIDLKDFFPSVDQARVWKCLQLKPFNLINTFDTKISEPEKTSASIGFAIHEKVIKNIKQKRLYIKYEDILLNKGSYYLKLKAGGGIPYTVEVDEFNIFNGFIIINVSKSNLIPIKDSIKLSNKENNEITNDKIVSIIVQLIKYHFDKKISKNNRNNLANIIASLCCTELNVERKKNGEWIKENRNVLPQGAPTSPVITNIVCQRLDYLLSGVAKRFGLKYSRYADDITFSSMHSVYQPGSAFLKELHRIIAEQNFHIKESKTRLQKDGYRKEVTGLLVNEKVNVQQRYIKQLRMWLYYWERYGYERASGFFLQQYIADKGHVKNGKPDMANVISGKLDYLKMVKGGDNELYLKLKSRFDLLIGFEDPTDQVLNVWETDGIEQAMDFYYKNKLE